MGYINISKHKDIENINNITNKPDLMCVYMYTSLAPNHSRVHIFSTVHGTFVLGDHLGL